jgi:peroxiredoxin
MKSMLKSLVFVMAVFFTTPASPQELQPMLDQMAPAFTLSDLDGNEYSLEQLRGKYIVIHFAATWCPFCNAEAPNLNQLYNDYRDKGVAVFIIDVREDIELIKKAFARFNFSFPVLLDADGKVSANYAPEGVQPALERYEVPIASNLIVDKEGRIRFYSLLNTTSFDAKLTSLKLKLDQLIEAAK